MRFPAEDIWKVRLGEQTRLTIPYERKPCPFKVAGFYVLEREFDVVRRVKCQRCGETGYRKDGKPCFICGGHGERVYYERRAERLEGEERAHVASVEKIHPADISDDQALEEGWESADEWRDVFFATYGECEWVWTITFALSKQVPQYMATQQGTVDPPQYVTTPERALDDSDAPTGDEYRAWSETAEAQLRRQRELRRLEERRRSLDGRIEQLRRRAA